MSDTPIRRFVRSFRAETTPAEASGGPPDERQVALAMCDVLYDGRAARGDMSWNPGERRVEELARERLARRRGRGVG